jgi:hypothetical protein
MSRFDWADEGVFDISDVSDEDFRAHFNSMPQQDREKILEALTSETEDAAARARALEFVSKVGQVVLSTIGTVI